MSTGEAAQDVSADLGVSRALSLAATLLDAAPSGLTKAEIRSRVDLYDSSAGSSVDAFEQMFSRDKRYLRRNGIEIDERLPHDASRRGDHDHRYLIDPESYGLPGIELTAEEAAVLRRVTLLWSGSRAQQSIREVVGALDDRSRLSRGTAESPEPSSSEQTSLSGGVAPPHRVRWGEDQEIDHVQALLTQGIGAPVTFDYAARGTRRTQTRRVLSWGWGVRGRWYLVGYDLDRQAVRIFRLDRIRGEISALAAPDEGWTEQDRAAQQQTANAGAEELHRKATAYLDALGDSAEPALVPLEAAVTASAVELEEIRRLSDRRLRDLLRARLDAVARAHQQLPSPPAALPAVKAAKTPDAAPRKIARLLNMAAHLESTGGARLSTLLERFALTPQQLHRDLISLQQAGSFDADRFGEFIDLTPDIPLSRRDFTQQLIPQDPVISIRLPAGRMSAVMARPLHLSTPGALSLLIGLEGLLAAEDSAEQSAAARSLREKIRGIVPEAVADAAASLSVAWTVENDPAVQRTLQILGAAVPDGHSVEIDYEDRQGRASTRRVDPVHLIHDGRGSYLQAWCHDAQAERHFRISRIRRARPLPQTRIGAEALALAAQEPRPPAVPAEGDLRAVVWAAPSAVATVRGWAPERAADSAEGGLFAEIRLPSQETLERMIIDAEGEIILCAPQSAVDSLRDRLVRGQRRLRRIQEQSRMLEADDERTAP